MNRSATIGLQNHRDQEAGDGDTPLQPVLHPKLREAIAGSAGLGAIYDRTHSVKIAVTGSSAPKCTYSAPRPATIKKFGT